MSNSIMKRIYLMFGLILFCQFAYCQDFYAMLDTAYVEFCKHKDPDNKLIFFKNRNYLNYNGSYTIAKRKKGKLYKTYYAEKHKKFSGKYCIDYPSVYFSEDSIYIVNHDLEIGDKGYFYGYSYISLFTYDKFNNKWNISKGYAPSLEFRSESSVDKIAKQCFLKAIDAIKNKANGKSMSIYRIADNCDGMLYLTEAEDIPCVPYGKKLSEYKSKADFFIGYPEMTLDKDVFVVNFKIIKSEQVGKSFKLEDAQTISVSHKINEHLLLSNAQTISEEVIRLEVLDRFQAECSPILKKVSSKIVDEDKIKKIINLLNSAERKEDVCKSTEDKVYTRTTIVFKNDSSIVLKSYPDGNLCLGDKWYFSKDLYKSLRSINMSEWIEKNRLQK